MKKNKKNALIVVAQKQLKEGSKGIFKLTFVKNVKKDLVVKEEKKIIYKRRFGKSMSFQNKLSEN